MATSTETKNEPAKAKRAAGPRQNPVSPPVLDIQTILVTPAQAKKWLGSNAEDNRHVRWTRVEAYARDMERGRWQLTGEAIKIDVDGVLIDGQHRLQAVIKANISVYMVVVFNLPHEAMAALDGGLSRTFGDRLKGVSQSYRNQISSVVRRVVGWDRGNRMGKSDTPTHAELLIEFDKDPEGFTAATLHGMDVTRQKICAASSAGTAFYLFARINEGQANTFFEGLKTGANLADTSPVLAVRNRLSRTSVRRETRLKPEDQLALLIRAWNAFREDRELDRLVIAKGALTNKNYPVPR
ncbi:MAG: hypothetical protein ABWY93_04820 [Mycobacterium sp.]